MHVCVCMYVCKYVCMYECCVYVCTYICTYVYTQALYYKIVVDAKVSIIHSVTIIQATFDTDFEYRSHVHLLTSQRTQVWYTGMCVSPKTLPPPQVQ